MSDAAWVKLGDKWGFEWAYRYKTFRQKDKPPHIEIARRHINGATGSNANQWNPWKVRCKVPIDWLDLIVNSPPPEETVPAVERKAKAEKPKETADEKIERLMKKLQGKANK